jgi:hypothetical protein
MYSFDVVWHPNTHIYDCPMWSEPTPRIKNYWVIHCILKFDAFQCRKPSKQELEIVLTSFNAEFKAPSKQEIVIVANIAMENHHL